MLSPSISQKFKVETLLSLGCKRWQKNGMDRIYVDEATLYQLLDIKASYHNTGSLSSCSQDDEVLSNTQGNKVLSSLAYCKFYYDVVSDAYCYKHSQGCVDLHNTVFKRLDEYLLAKYDAHKVAVTAHEITPEKLDKALGF